MTTINPNSYSLRIFFLQAQQNERVTVKYKNAKNKSKRRNLP